MLHSRPADRVHRHNHRRWTDDGRAQVRKASAGPWHVPRKWIAVAHRLLAHTSPLYISHHPPGAARPGPSCTPATCYGPATDTCGR